MGSLHVFFVDVSSPQVTMSKALRRPPSGYASNSLGCTLLGRARQNVFTYRRRNHRCIGQVNEERLLELLGERLGLTIVWLDRTHNLPKITSIRRLDHGQM